MPTYTQTSGDPFKVFSQTEHVEVASWCYERLLTSRAGGVGSNYDHYLMRGQYSSYSARKSVILVRLYSLWIGDTVLMPAGQLEGDIF